MLDIHSALILGLVQGLTEFLPVSSTGHLILARQFFNLDASFGLAFDALLHFATAAAVLIYFREYIIELIVAFVHWISGRGIEAHNRIMILALILGTIPAVIAGLFLEEMMDSVFRDPHLVAYVLIAGSVLMYAAERYAKTAEQGYLTLKKGLIIGCFQALALVPGMSRSGATISGGLFMGLSREEAARFGFLLAIPIILGAGSKKVLELEGVGAFQDFAVPLAVGAITAFAVGLAAIHYLLKFLRTRTLMVFIVYRLILAAAVLMFI